VQTDIFGNTPMKSCRQQSGVGAGRIGSQSMRGSAETAFGDFGDIALAVQLHDEDGRLDSARGGPQRGNTVADGAGGGVRGAGRIEIQLGPISVAPTKRLRSACQQNVPRN
jgi:hypothetical protein